MMFQTLKILFKRAKPFHLSFQQKFGYFQKLLSSNDDSHRFMSELGEMLVSGKPFSKGRATKNFLDLSRSTELMTKQLILLSNGKYKNLLDSFRKINDLCDKILSPKVYCPEGWECPDSNCDICTKVFSLQEDTPYYYHISEIDNSKKLVVGSKMSNLGEIRNRLSIPTPDSFALTIRVFEEIMQNENIRDKKNRIFYDVNFEDISQVQKASHQAQELINSTIPPMRTEQIILEAFDKFFDAKSKVAVRSSARGEDSSSNSFAGLHHSELNVSRENLMDACIEVLLSKYSPESVVYRYLSGLRDEDMPMSVGCVEMVDAVSGGVLFTADPINNNKNIIIQAVYGLGVTVVEGTAEPQQFIVEHRENPKILNFTKGNQNYIKKAMETDGVSRVNISAADTEKPCLTKENINQLVEYALKIERHYNSPQDIEWAVDSNGKVIILQTRPLIIQKQSRIDEGLQKAVVESASKFILQEGGDCVSRGVGHGPIFVINNLRDITRIVNGSVIIAKKNYAELAGILHKVSAVITEVGSTTGHLSIIARELEVPFITNMADATKLKSGDEVTVFADQTKIYKGRINGLIDLYVKNRDKLEPFRLTPLYRIVHRLSKYIFKLNLTKPNAPNFSPEYCATIHDVIRFAHENGMKEMFSIYENTRAENTATYKLDFNIPLNIYIIDLGNGLKVKSPVVTPDMIDSKPMVALIKGMQTPGIQWGGPLSVDFKGFVNIMMTNATDSTKTDRVIGSKSYALISDNYINFFSRLGYHFSRLDALASDERNMNYINFHFRGGAADPERRVRRAKVIKKILEHFDFNAIRTDDNVIARIRKIDKEKLYELLEMIGKLMGAVRNTDVTLTDESKVERFVQYFLEGDVSPASRFE